MQKVLMIALSAVPFVACVGTTGDVEGGDDFEGTETVGTVEQELRTPDYLVDFDQVQNQPIFFATGSTPVASGSIVDTAYAGYGVTFSCVTASRAYASTSCTAGNVYARLSGGSNVVAPHPQLQSFDVRFGVLQASFANPKDWVMIDVTPIKHPEHIGNTLAAPWIAAYDANDQWIATTQYPVLYPNTGWDQPRTLSINAGSARIKYVRFSSSYYSSMANVGGKFDNLQFNGDELRPVAILDPRPPILRPIQLIPAP
ncbi:MAG TPA: hypothetical protein VI197_22585 [Polyangiaceae bacterium]